MTRSERRLSMLARVILAGSLAAPAGCLSVQAPPRGLDSPAHAHATAEVESPDIDQSPYPKFVADPTLAGTVRCVGSSAVGLILNAIRKDFNDAEPDVELQIVSSGSGDAPKMLASGQSDLAPMSRAMKPEEIALVEKARGGKVEYVDIAIDAIAISVNRRNPLMQVSMKDLDRLFGRERRRGGAPALTWGEIGLTDDAWRENRVMLFGMGPKSGSHGIVQEVVLKGGTYRTSINEEPVSSSVVQAVATNPSAIGYCSAYFVDRAPRTRALLLEATDGSGYVGPTEEAVRSGRYPLSRSLRIYFVRDPVRPNPAAMQFLRFLVSEDGQWAIGELGQRKISPEQAHASFAALSRP